MEYNLGLSKGDRDDDNDNDDLTNDVTVSWGSTVVRCITGP